MLCGHENVWLDALKALVHCMKKGSEMSQMGCDLIELCRLCIVEEHLTSACGDEEREIEMT